MGSKNKAEATQYINRMSKIGFVIAIIYYYRLLHPIWITQKSQDRTLDTIDAYQNKNTLPFIEDNQQLRYNAFAKLSAIYKEVVRMAEKPYKELNIPHITERTS